jgi:hypothetical protein
MSVSIQLTCTPGSSDGNDTTITLSVIYLEKAGGIGQIRGYIRYMTRTGLKISTKLCRFKLPSLGSIVSVSQIRLEQTASPSSFNMLFDLVRIISRVFFIA